MDSKYEFSHWDSEGYPISTDGTPMQCSCCGNYLNEELHCDSAECHRRFPGETVTWELY